MTKVEPNKMTKELKLSLQGVAAQFDVLECLPLIASESRSRIALGRWSVRLSHPEDFSLYISTTSLDIPWAGD
jgi:hypothetical protein